jgi:hypothetical protein
MREHEVWSRIITKGMDCGWQVICASPPGATSYEHPRSCLIDTRSGKRDEPDIIFLSNRSLIIVECKPTLAALLSSQSGESDCEKLLRIHYNFMTGLYNEQMRKNYGINLSDPYSIVIALGYGENKGKTIFEDARFIHLIVSGDDVSLISNSTYCLL